MNLRLCSLLLVSLSLSVAAGAAGAAGLDQYLVARWTFNDGSLKADKGGYLLRMLEIGSGSSLTVEKGQANLGRGTLLACENINSATMPKLGRNITIWARLRIDAPAPATAFLFGLRDQVPAGDWKNMVLAVRARDLPANATNAFVRFATGSQMNSPSLSVALEPGKFVSVALVFDGDTKAVTYVVDGQSLVGKHKDAVALGDFNNFAIGRLKEAGAVAMTIDEVRIYSVALSPEWVADITPVK
ncbi:MAG: LamG-like jellyroll fold domain-containing protein [Opitutaceae bacterium]|jgi:hypothetical protein